MRLKAFRIRNYKGFNDSEWISLGPNWTVIVGRNNVGKTALLEALSFGQFQNKPHRHPTQPFGYPLPAESIVEVEVCLSGEELKLGVLVAGGGTVPVPLPTPVDYVLKDVFGRPRLEFTIRKTGNESWRSERQPSHGLFEVRDGSYVNLVLNVSTSRQLEITGGQSSNDGLPSLVGAMLTKSTYVFRAERRVAGTSALQDSTALYPDAANLSGALHYLLSNNRTEFARLERLFKKVFPDVEAISIPPVSGSTCQIRIWNSGFEEGRDDLAIPLEECGTGIGQVLAMLFVLVTAKTSKIIVIDEPNSFLHPGASRVLMQILRQYDQHQFIVTTHSPEIISATEPERLVLITWQNHQSCVAVSDGASIDSIRASFEELGVRLSDVFGYDAVIWLEGQTEAKCFPLLCASDVEMPARTTFVPLANTGDLEGASATTIWQAYKQLAQQSAFVPRTIAISLDREFRSAAEREDLTKRSGGLIHFLPRATYENYLLHSGAIAAVLQHEDRESTVTPDVVDAWIKEHSLNPKYYRSQGVPTNPSEWAKVVDAPKLLHDLILAVTSHTQDFKGRKVRYSTALTQWLREYDPSHLEEAVEYVKALLANAGARSAKPAQAVGKEII